MCQESEADKWHVHTLRHSIAVHMLDAGHTQEEVKDQLGHKYILYQESKGSRFGTSVAHSEV